MNSHNLACMRALAMIFVVCSLVSFVGYGQTTPVAKEFKLDQLLENGKEAYHKGEFIKAYEFYHRADSIFGLQDSTSLKNYERSAKRIGQEVLMEHCGDFQEMEELKASVKNLGMNTRNADFSPSVIGEEILFTSSRRNRGNRKLLDYFHNKQPFLDIYMWSNGRVKGVQDYLPSGLNTDLHDGPAFVTRDSNFLFVTRNYKVPNKEGKQNLYIDFYLRDQNSWKHKGPLPFCHPRYTVQHAVFDTRSNILYFSSNRNRGYGGFDLYKVIYEAPGWGQVENLGSGINSGYDEVFPFLTPNGDLGFSTNHPCLSGSLDLVIAKNNKLYALPKPLNSEADDFGLAFYSSDSLFFSSNRKGGHFNDDVFSASVNWDDPELIPDSMPEYSEDSLLAQPYAGIQSIIGGDSLNQVFSKTFFSSEEIGWSQEEVGGSQLDSNIAQIWVTIPQFGVRSRDKPIENTGGAKDGLGNITGISGSGEKGSGAPTRGKDYLFSLPPLNLGNGDTSSIHLAKGTKQMPSKTRRPQNGANFKVYFWNDSPGRRSWEPSTNESYDDAYTVVQDSMPLLLREENARNLDSFRLETKKGMSQLNSLKENIKGALKAGDSLKIILQAHTSALGSKGYNFNLAHRRAKSLENTLYKALASVSPSQLKNLEIVYDIKGESEAHHQFNDEDREALYTLRAAQDRYVKIRLCY